MNADNDQEVQGPEVEAGAWKEFSQASDTPQGAANVKKMTRTVAPVPGPIVNADDVAEFTMFGFGC